MAVEQALLDTNIVLYHLGGRLEQPLGNGDFFVSVITEMELLSYSSMSADEEKLIHSFLDDITVVELNISIRQVAIAFRKKYGLKLPDAIVGATAMTLGLPLLTNDLKLARLEEVEVIDCPLRTG